MRLPDTEPRVGKYNTFVTQLHKAANGDPQLWWLKFPGQSALSPGSRTTYRARINSGELLGPGFEARTRNGWLYVRVKP